MCMNDVIQDALDDLASAKSSTARQGRALRSLERLLADICVAVDDASGKSLHLFVALQDTFQCNVPLRLLSWISKLLPQLTALTMKSPKEPDPELACLSSQLAQALSIIQGIALIHRGSKDYLGRRHPIEVLVELFYTARRVPSMPAITSENLPVPSSFPNDSTRPSVPLANAVLDTLLCILVDSPPATRIFEDANGVQMIIKIFKRSATSREVRMKCIEFLYFYLMDENSPAPVDHSGIMSMSWPAEGLSQESELVSDMVPTAPSSPTHTSHRSVFSVSQLNDSSVSSLDSCATSTSAASSSTRATSVSSSRRSSVSYGSSTPQLSASPVIVNKPKHARANSVQPLSLSVLKHQAAHGPLTPKKAPISKLGIGTPRTTSRMKLQPLDHNVLSSDETEQEETSTSSMTARLAELQTPRRVVQRAQTTSLRQFSPDSTPSTTNPSSVFRGHRRAQSSIEVGSLDPYARSPPIMPLNRSKESARAVLPPPRSGTRTMEEKKAFLGTMLGNVDALVEGIQKQGIFGLA